MTREIYYVVFDGRDWMINHRGKHYGPYSSQKEAIAVAVDSAQNSGGRNPFGAQVRTRDANNELRIEWTYGNHYPPLTAIPGDRPARVRTTSQV